jgi:MFS transporter, CP family, cyanate transporter
MQGGFWKSASRMPPAGTRAAATLAGTLRFFWLLWLAGLAMRMTLLVVPPVIPLIHEDLRMSETQIGLLIGLPLALFAIAAVPGSLLVARGGAKLAVTLGMIIAAVAGGLRGAAFDVWTLYAAAVATGFGIAIMQPGMPKLVHDWLPNRIGMATVVYSNGMVVGAILPPVLTIPFILPLVGGSWRLNFFVWAAPAILITIMFLLLSPKETQRSGAAPSAIGALWWPDWRNPLIWLLGFTFGSNNSPFFAANAFLGDYLASRGQADLLGPALASLNGAQLIALVLLFVVVGRLQRRAWPFLLFGPVMLAGFLGLILIQSPLAVLACTALIGISTVMTMTPILALPPLLAAPGDVARTAAGMLTISYTCAIVIPTLCGALWDMTGKPWIVFVPLCLCAVALTVLGSIVSRRRPAAHAAHS